MTLAVQQAAPPTPVGRGRRLLSPALVSIGGAAVCTVLYVVDPETPGHYPTCPFLALTGHYCPGCGSLRAVHALLHGDVRLALQRNPLAVVTAVLLLAGMFIWVRRLWQGRQRTWVVPAWLLYCLLAVVLAFWALRNVPGWTWLSPA